MESTDLIFGLIIAAILIFYLIFRIYSYQSALMSGTMDYLRKVDVTSKKNIEYTKYIELRIKGTEIISFKEFASFDI